MRLIHRAVSKGPRLAANAEDALASPPTMQIAALIEAVTLGYTMARKTRLP
jgi:hypothetical protein